MPRWCSARFASRSTALLLCAAVAACGGPQGPAPMGKPQQPYAGAPKPAISSHPLEPPTKEAVKVAILLPLSGPNADLGKAMLDAAQLALFTTGNDRLTLVPRDTTGTADGAANAAKRESPLPCA